MIELPEALTLAGQLRESFVGRVVSRVLPPNRAHKFCWYRGDPAAYDAALRGRRAISAAGFGMFAELSFDGGQSLCVNDGVNVRRAAVAEGAPKAYQLLIEFQDGEALVFTVAMYGGILLHDSDYDDAYYVRSRQGVSPFSREFAPAFQRLLAESKPSLSAKAFLATEQRFPGIGNGVLQDILFAARIHPKRKLETLSGAERVRLCACASSVLEEMRARGGRDTEKDLFGRPGGYATRMSRNALQAGCPVCFGPITKETYLGGSVYYCARCQPLSGARGEESGHA